MSALPRRAPRADRPPCRMNALLAATLAACLAGPPDAGAQTPGGAWTLTLENDALTGSDNNYTHGLGLSWVSTELQRYDAQSPVRRWGELWSFLPFLRDAGYRRHVAWGIGQEIHTPDDLSRPDPPAGEPPYAGLLFADSAVYARRDGELHAWQLRLGVVGPAAGGRPVQKAIHKLTGSEPPRGWRTQLPNEPVVNLAYTGAWRLAEGRLGASTSWRLVSVANAGLGNYFTGAGAGIYVEVGRRLVDALGGTALRQGLNVASTVGVGPVGDAWSVSLSGGVAGYAVAHYLPLDGTVLRDSRSVDSRPFTAMGTLGLTARRRDLVLFLGATRLTRNHAGERRQADFGTASLARHY